MREEGMRRRRRRGLHTKAGLEQQGLLIGIDLWMRFEKGDAIE